MSAACRASRDGWCKTHSTTDSPAWCVDTLRDAVRRARFHERENYDRWQKAQAAIDRVSALAAVRVGTGLLIAPGDTRADAPIWPDEIQAMLRGDE